MPEEQATFTVLLVSAGGQKLTVAKLVKDVTGLGMKEALGFVNNLPRAVRSEVPAEEAKGFAKLLTDAGATVKIV